MNELKLPMSPKVQKTSFKGSPQYNLSVMKYLKNKYKDACVILPDVNIKKDLSHVDVSLRWIQKDQKNGYFSIPNNYWKYFSKCTNKRFIVFPFGFSCSNFVGHANYMIYDLKNKSLERFEPYGKSFKSCSNPKNIDNKIKKLFNDNLRNMGIGNFVENYYKPVDFLNTRSFQRIQEDEGEMSDGSDPPGGYCAIWSCWYAELRLANPDKDRKYVINHALKKLKESELTLTEYIRNYAEYVVKNCKN
jgi:hypothetical protein